MIDLRYLDTPCQAGRKDPDLSIPEASFLTDDSYQYISRYTG